MGKKEKISSRIKLVLNKKMIVFLSFDTDTHTDIQQMAFIWAPDQLPKSSDVLQLQKYMRCGQNMSWESSMRGSFNKHLRKPFIGAHLNIGADMMWAILSHGALHWNSQSYSVDANILDFDWECLSGNPCSSLVGMLLNNLFRK